VRRTRTALGLALLVGTAASILVPSSGVAQSRNQFGRAERAAAASEMITSAVQQAISQLPPAGGQAFTYTFDRRLSTYVRSDRLGPTQFITPETIGSGSVNVRLALSYFHLEDEFGPIFYRATPRRKVGDGAPPIVLFTKFGLEVKADVALADLAVTYGVFHWLDLFVDVPIVLVNAHADQTFVGRTTALADPSKEVVDELIELTGLGRQSLAERGTFNSGTSVGVGRIHLGAKASLYAGDDLEIGAITRLAFASPSSAEFAGSDTYAVYPRVVARFLLRQPLQIFLDAGYDYDFSSAELRRFAWNTGVSLGLPTASIDLGLGGSLYDSPIRWTPLVAPGDPFDDPRLDPEGRFREGSILTVDDPGESELETDFVNLLIGGKVELSEGIVLSAALTIPLTTGLRPDVLTTIGVEASF
jgi:hypothetical protein